MPHTRGGHLTVSLWCSARDSAEARCEGGGEVKEGCLEKRVRGRVYVYVCNFDRHVFHTVSCSLSFSVSLFVANTH